MALVPSPYDHPRRNGRSAKKTMFLIDIQSGTVRYYFQRNLIYKKILSRIFLPLLFRDSTYCMGPPREVSEYGHFVFFLPIIEEPWLPLEIFSLLACCDPKSFKLSTSSDKFYNNTLSIFIMSLSLVQIGAVLPVFKWSAFKIAIWVNSTCHIVVQYTGPPSREALMQSKWVFNL